MLDGAVAPDVEYWADYMDIGADADANTVDNADESPGQETAIPAPQSITA